MEPAREYVGIDLHRRRSVIVRKDADGALIDSVRINNSAMALAQALTKAGPNPEVVIEATNGWYWAADVINDLGADLHLAHPLGNNWGHRRVKKMNATPRTLSTCSASVGSRRPGWPRRSGESCESSCAIASSSGTCALGSSARSMPCLPKKE